MGNESPKKSNLPSSSKTKQKSDSIPRRSSVRTHNPSSSFGGTISRSLALRRPHFADTPTNGEPSTKKNRHVREETPRGREDDETEESDCDDEEEVNKRRRKTTKHGECAMCKEEQQPNDEQLMECKKCKAKYHLKKCLRYNGELEANLRSSDKLICPRCILCAACETYITDPSNVECSLCCQAWHGACAPPGHRTTQDFDSPWFCNRCCRKKHIREMNSPKPPTQINTQNLRTRKQKKEVREKLEFAVDVDKLEELCNLRDNKTDSLKIEAGLSVKKPNPVLTTKNKKDRKRKSSHEEYYDTKMLHDENFPKSVRKDVEMFERSKNEAYPSTSSPPAEQYLHFGDGKSCKTLYKSAFDEPLQSSPHIFVCKFCLFISHQKEDLVAHWDQCLVWHPPGNEIYRDDNLSFFEVDGATKKYYCQTLCLISKLFIASKTLYDEVETFKFYVLCERSAEGFAIVGYFSKEHLPAENNNLSCLLVFPTAQKKGYGRLLIDMSYELSRIEHKVGHPEHPLSDLGILAYRGYWRSSILCYIRNHRSSDGISIKDMCLSTRIWKEDIVNQLMIDNIITRDKGAFNIKMARRALKYPLSQFRRRCVDPTKLFWKPKRNKVPLDPSKINTYSS